MSSVNFKKSKRIADTTAATPNKRARPDSALPSRDTTGDPSGTTSPDWLDMPAELYATICRFLPSLHFLLVLSSVNHRLYWLIHGADASGVLGMDAGPASGPFMQGLFWRHLSPVRFAADDTQSPVNVELENQTSRQEQGEAKTFVWLALAGLRHVPALLLTVTTSFDRLTVSAPLLHTCLQALGAFVQLTSLTLKLYLPAAEANQPEVRITLNFTQRAPPPHMPRA